MNLIDVMTAVQERGEMALVAYLTGGFPTMNAFAENLRAAAAGGADVIEVGIPFSDPMADGPTIQYSSQVALAAGARFEAILGAVREARSSGDARWRAVPVIVMSYLNPLIAVGQASAFQAMSDAGISGLIAADLPVDEWDVWQPSAERAGVSLIAMAAPTSTDARLAMIAERSRGFVYVVSTTGVTGVRGELSDRLPGLLAKLRSLTKTPLVAGFGISRPEHVRQLRGQADGVIVGSRLVEAIRTGEDLESVVRGLKDATRAAR